MSAAIPENLPEIIELRLAHQKLRQPAQGDETPAAVLLPLYREDDAWHLLFTRRTDTLEAHSGQISFPGGTIEPQDNSPVRAALREAQEELGLASNDVRILGTLTSQRTVTNFAISPVVGVIPWPYPLRPNALEVAAFFGVPLAWLMDPENLQAQRRMHHHDGTQFLVSFYKPYEGQVIWGATARITLDFLRIIHHP